MIRTQIWFMRGGVLLVLLLAGWGAGSALRGRRFDPWTPRSPHDHTGVRPDGPGSSRIRVLTTIFPLYDFARTIGGPDAEVRNLLPPGVDPHEFALSPRDAELIAGADVILANGVGLDDFILEAVRKAGVSEKRITRITDVKAGGQIDPHRWVDPVLAQEYVRHIGNALVRTHTIGRQDVRDDTVAAGFRNRAKAFQADMERLATDYRRELEPLRGRSFITFHGAFTYLANRFGLKVPGVWQQTPGREPAPREVAALLRTAREQHVRALLAEPQFSARALEMIAADAHLPVYTLDPLETAENFDHTHYIPVMRRNLEVLVKALR